MGIKGLGELLKKLAPNSIVPVWTKFPPEIALKMKDRGMVAHLDYYENTTFVVDVAGFMYKFAYHKKPGDDEAFLYNFVDQYEILRKNGKNRVYYVFDGAALDMKKGEIQKRIENQIQNRKRIVNKLASLDEKEKIVNGARLLEVKQMLEKLAEPVGEPVGEPPCKKPRQESPRKSPSPAPRSGSPMISPRREKSGSPQRERSKTPGGPGSVKEWFLYDENDNRIYENAEAYIKAKKEKEEELKKEKEQLEILQKQMMSEPSSIFQKLAEIKDQKEKTSKQNIHVSKLHYENLKKLFRARKIPYFVAKHEAEFCASWLVTSGFADVVVSDDWDAAVSGAPRVLRHMSSAKEMLTEVSHERILKDLKLTKEQFTDVCILAGCDFCPTLPRIAIHTGYKLIVKYGSIEKFLDSFEAAYLKTDPSVLQSFCYQEARGLLSITKDTPCQYQEEISIFEPVVETPLED